MTIAAHETLESEVPAGVLDGTEPPDPNDPGYDLPPFGCDYAQAGMHGQAAAFLSRLAREASDAKDGHVDGAEENAVIYRQGQLHRPAEGQVITNDIQTAVLSITDIQTREPFAIYIRPVEIRDRPQVFWIGPPVDERVAAITGLPLGMGMAPTGQVDPVTGQPVMLPSETYEPLDEVTAWQVRRLAQAGAFPSDWFVSVDDRLVADVYQTVFDVFWKEAAVDDFVRQNLLETNVYGYQTAYYSWDNQRKRHVVRPISIKQVYLDPSQMDVGRMGYVGFDVPMPVDQAKAEYPQLSPVIEQTAKIGTPSRVDSNTEFGVATDRDFQRRTVTFRIFWLRDQDVHMLPHEAERAGLVTLGDDGNYYHAQPDDSGAAVAANGGAPAPVSGGDAGAEPARGPDEQLTDPRPWPTAKGIRQIATLAQTGQIVQDVRCEHWDIPVVLNVCIPTPGQPFGQGIPEKLKGMQQADIRLLNAFVLYAETFANPGAQIAASAAAMIRQGLKRNFVSPREMVEVPDEFFDQKYGTQGPIRWTVPPAMPPAVPDAMAMLERRFKETSGHPEVMQGVAPSPTSSGKMIEALQAGAAGQFGFQAQWTARMVERLANLMHYSHLWRLELSDMMSIYSRLPEPIMKLVINRARAGRWDIQVDANSGASGQTNKRLQRALALFTARSSTGEPAMTLKTLREIANLDDEEETVRYRTEMQAATPTVQQPQQQQTEPRSVEGKQGPGNGHPTSGE